MQTNRRVRNAMIMCCVWVFVPVAAAVYITTESLGGSDVFSVVIFAIVSFSVWAIWQGS